MIPFRKLVLGAAAALLPLWSAAAGPAPRAGVLILAHGGDQGWNKEVESIRRQLSKRRKVEVAFGMADGGAMQAAVDRLQAAGAPRIVAVPLFVSSHSSIMRQSRYLLGLSSAPDQGFEESMAGMAGHGGMGMSDSMDKPVRAKVPIEMTSALDDDPLVAGILAERAKALSKDPKSEALVVVGHGPVEESDVAAWEALLQSLAGQVRAKLPFREARAATIRDDAPGEVRAKAVQALRDIVASLGRSGPVLVIPDLIAQGGIEGKIEEALKGVPHRWDGKTLAPHPDLARWVERQVGRTEVQ